MSQIASKLVLLGVKHSVVAFDRVTGARVWMKDFGGSLSGGDFVTVVADDERVYVHARGEVYCLDLATGAQLWHDKLSGFGYGLASIALPGAQAHGNTALARRRQEEESSQSAAVAGSGGSS